MSTSLPALSEHPTLRLATVTGMYLAQGIQLGLMMVSLPAHLAENGVAPAAVGGFMGATMLPWTLKLASAPLMDRLSFLPMGRRRPWVLGGLLGAAVGYLVMGAVPDPLDHLGWLTAAAVLASTFTAVMDVAIDGMAIDIFPLPEQARANGFMWGGKVIGAAATSAGAAWFLDDFGLAVTFYSAAVFTLLFALLPLAFRERPGERLLPWSTGVAAPENLAVQLGEWRTILRSLFQVILLPASLLIAGVSFLHGLTYGLFDALAPVIAVQELGWEATAFSSLAALAGLSAGLVGMAFGGRTIRALGRERAMATLLAGLVLIGVAMGVARTFWGEPVTMPTFVVLVYLFRTLMLIALFATAMALCWRPVAATQFAIYMAIGNLGISAGAGLLGPLTRLLSYPVILFSFAGIAACAIFLLLFLRVEGQVRRLAAMSLSTEPPRPG